MFSKGSKLYSIFKFKCPKCHEGEFFISRNLYDLKCLGKNHEKCDCCGHKFELETGFFYGAMYVSYALAIAFSVAIGVAIYVLFPESPYYVYITAILSGLVLLMPLTFGLSRMIWMNFFTSYDQESTSCVRENGVQLEGSSIRGDVSRKGAKARRNLF